MKRSKELARVGWREWVSLPDLGVGAIKAKVDTGARTSALHAFNLEEYESDGVERVRFLINPEQGKARDTLSVDVPLLARRKVRNSGGKVELRPVIKTNLGLLGRTWRIELTLTSRDSMGFRMLLGRQAIRGHVLVDPGKSYLAGKRSELQKQI